MAKGEKPWAGRLNRIAAGLFLLLGIWYLGGGLYIHAKAVLAQLLLQQAWEKTLAGTGKVHPWPWADTWPIAKISVPVLGVQQLVLAGASGRSLAFAPGHVDGTATPGGNGNTVISGHRDTHFSWLAQLHDGDEILLGLSDGTEKKYRVVQQSIHHESETGLLAQKAFPMLRLITCYPFDAIVPGGPLRFVVSAKPSGS